MSVWKNTPFSFVRSGENTLPHTHIFISLAAVCIDVTDIRYIIHRDIAHDAGKCCFISGWHTSRTIGPMEHTSMALDLSIRTQYSTIWQRTTSLKKYHTVSNRTETRVKTCIKLSWKWKCKKEKDNACSRRTLGGFHPRRNHHRCIHFWNVYLFHVDRMGIIAPLLIKYRSVHWRQRRRWLWLRHERIGLALGKRRRNVWMQMR